VFYPIIYLDLSEDFIMVDKPTYEELERKVKELEHEVVERRRAEEELKENITQLRMEKDFFQEAISAVSHPFYAIDANTYEILMINPAAISIFGELTNAKTCFSLTHGRTEPCSGEEHPCPLEIIKKTKQSVTVEHTHFDKKGRPLFYEIHAYPVFDTEGNVTKIIEYSLDITKFKRAQEAQRESEERYRELIESAHDIIQSIQPDGSLSFVNHAWHKILGYTETDLASINLFDIIHADSLQHCMELFSKVMTGQSMNNIPVILVAKDGTKVSVEGNVSPRIIDGKVVSTHGIFRDVTERNLAEEELAKYSKHLEQIVAELNVAQEVQQSLLPQRAPEGKHFDLAGGSLYCDETGGDYYDYIELPNLGSDVYGVVVGDVSGHGISSALLMASTRAYLRGRVTQPGSIAEIVTDVNRLVSADTMDTGQFMTFFFLVIEARTGRVTWVRAGHDPAIVYSPDSDHFEELKGEGLPLGVNEDWSYEDYTIMAKPGQILVLSTDGVWEAHNGRGEMFGKKRLKEVIRQTVGFGAEGTRRAIFKAVSTFQGEASQEDDLTLVVWKFL
jgi:sigma-B regulation protein RsbU (phosphoserine phosphatase)